MARIQNIALANAIAFRGGVKQADESLELIPAVLPVLPLSSVPPPASAGRMPFAAGSVSSAVAAELSQVGLRCISNEVIVRLDRIIIPNINAATAITVSLFREDGLGAAVDGVEPIRPLYIDAGPDTISSPATIVRDSEAAGRGVEVFGGADIVVFDETTFVLELTSYIQGGTLWVVEQTAQQSVRAIFVGEIIPVVQRQPPG